MAENLKWLAEEMYPDRKLIVWAHNGHIMNAYYQPDWSALAHEPTVDGAKPMGSFIAQGFGEAVYTIGFTAFAGEHAPVTLPVTQRIGAMPEESVVAVAPNL
jgi:erythromycin esterase